MGTLAIVGALLIFLWILTFQVADLMYAIVTASFFLIGGLALGVSLVGVNFRLFFTKDIIPTIMLTGANVLVILFVNQLVPIRFDLTVINPQLFGVLVGVAEECFFRLFLCGFFYRITHNQWLAIGVSAVIWSGYHIARYGGQGAGVFILITISGFMLGATYLLTRNADAPIFAHALVNFIALA
jgi:membrane protease YdiL (CAAX protease family)